MRIVTLLTDFGSYYPGVMKGVIWKLAPEAIIADITHEVEPQNIFQGAFLLYHSYRYFDGAIHVAVVDPGVGSGRRALAVLTRNNVFIGPDNGILYPSASEDGIVKVYEISESVSELVGTLSTTFHGRDVFAPAAALALRGKYEGYFKETDRMLRMDIFDYAVGEERIRCRVAFVDRFGNIVTNLRAEDVKAKAFYFGGVKFPVVRTYSEVDPGEPLALIGSFGTLELSVREGNASDLVGIRKGNVEIELEVV
ncbi:SAM hydrolase/SAM-dependent halogenase family protein [Archaeoglobus neptunius]|uniref:SAM hydrolase/SAM-dependent halogenase family protein n=1 Tax=Archaeoglobus neptunius TaxID=2798580 RepID=UPI0019261790|nr:S-adenosyl-l-methionine hydroxide adenosyltransferase family protein [Archaeoglobus neptunius]